MRWLLVAFVTVCVGCSTTFQLRVGKDPATHKQPVQAVCGLYSPPATEYPPIGVNIDSLPIEDPELVALLLAGENRELRAYIARRDQRDMQALSEYRASCTKPSNSSRVQPK